MKRLLLALLLALAPSSAAAAADPVVAAATVDRDSINVGDEVLFSVIVQAAAGYQVVDPGVPRVFGDFEVLETLPALQDPLRSGTTRLTFRYRITTFRFGDLLIPPLSVTYTAPSGQSGTVETSEIPIRVLGLLGPTLPVTDIRPLHPQLSLPSGIAPRIASAAALVEIGLTILFVAVLAVRRLRRRPGLAAEDAARVRPVRAALVELTRISELRLPEQGRLREHYELVAATLRDYVRARWGIAAAHQTPRELRVALERASVDRRQVALITEVLHEAELARYPRLAPYPAHAREAARAVLDVMRKAAADEDYHAAASGSP